MTEEIKKINEKLINMNTDLLNKSKILEKKNKELSENLNFEKIDAFKKNIYLKREKLQENYNIFKKTYIFIKKRIGLYNPIILYILYIHPSGIIELLSFDKPIKVLIHDKRRHELIRKFGLINNKPCFLVHYKFNLSLDLKDSNGLFVWDAEESYNILEHIITYKLTHEEESSGIFGFIAKNWWIFLIIIGLIVFLNTPYGKEFIAQFMHDLGLKGVVK